METNECWFVSGHWYCQHMCDDPSHGHRGQARVYCQGSYRRPGELIETIEL